MNPEPTLCLNAEPHRMHEFTEHRHIWLCAGSEPSLYVIEQMIREGRY